MHAFDYRYLRTLIPWTTVERVLSELCRSGDIRMIGGRRNARFAADRKNQLSEFRIEQEMAPRERFELPRP